MVSANLMHVIGKFYLSIKAKVKEQISTVEFFEKRIKDLNTLHIKNVQCFARNLKTVYENVRNKNNANKNKIRNFYNGQAVDETAKSIINHSTDLINYTDYIEKLRDDGKIDKTNRKMIEDEIMSLVKNTEKILDETDPNKQPKKQQNNNENINSNFVDSMHHPVAQSIGIKLRAKKLQQNEITLY